MIIFTFLHQSDAFLCFLPHAVRKNNLFSIFSDEEVNMLVDRGVSEEDTAEDGDPVESTDDEKKKKNFVSINQEFRILSYC